MTASDLTALRDGWQELLDASRDAMLIIDGEAIVLGENREARRLFGWAANELIGTPMARCVPTRFQRVLDLWPQEPSDSIVPPHDRGLAPVTLLARRRDGTEFPAEISRAVIGTAPERCVHVTIRDLTAWRCAQESLLREKEHALTTLDSIGDAVMTTDLAGRITYMNPVAERLTGWRNTQAIGEPMDIVLNLISDVNRQPMESPVVRCLREGRSIDMPAGVLLLRRDGTEVAIGDSAAPILDRNGITTGVVLVYHDVSERRRISKRLAHDATHDGLTGLTNRAEFERQVSRVLRHAADHPKDPVAHVIGCLDLDRFKAVNDTLGHPVGDRLLAQVARRLQLIMTPNELCGRLGGDEFAVVLKDATDSAYVSTLARRIIETISRPYEVDQNTLYIGASIGSALGPIDGRTVELLMRSADLALYRSKDQGGNTHHSYQHQLHANAEERRLMEFELRNALERKQLHVEYQPVVAAHGDNVLLGFEALVRWNNPKFGNVSPAKFVPVAEEARLIVPIGDFVLRQACKDAATWPDATRIAVNISVDQLTSPAFVDTVINALHDSGLPAYRLELEVTESIFLRDGGLAVQVLDQLRSLGIKLSLDDFGTGYSSLGYLRNVRFDTIKVDRSFVQGAAKNKSESLAIIRAVVALADSLNIATTAEGVENESELAMIQQLGCHKIQGYFFGRPMVYSDASALFNRQRNVA